MAKDNQPIEVNKNITTSDRAEFVRALDKLSKSKTLKELHFSGGITVEPDGSKVETYHVNWTDQENI